jgi:hypothetical protein
MVLKLAFDDSTLDDAFMCARVPSYMHVSHTHMHGISHTLVGICALPRASSPCKLAVLARWSLDICILAYLQELKPHQMAQTSDGLTVLQKAMIEVCICKFHWRSLRYFCLPGPFFLLIWTLFSDYPDPSSCLPGPFFCLPGPFFCLPGPFFLFTRTPLSVCTRKHPHEATHWRQVAQHLSFVQPL